MTKPRSRVEEITPEKAKRYLGMVKENRNKKVAAINTYAAAMKRGEWVEDAEPIFFSNGELIDGQNRLHAVVLSGATVKFRVTRGADLKLKYAIDTGVPRNFGDILKMEGYSRHTELAAVVRLEWTYRQSPDMFRPGVRPVKATHFELLEVLQKTPGLIRSLEAVSPWKKQMTGWCPLTTAAFLYYQFGRHDRDLCRDFWYGMASGIDLEEGSHVLKLRNWLIRTSNQVGVVITRRYRLAVLIKCWNAFIKGLMADKAIAWRQGGYNPEPFPKIQAPAEKAK